MVTQIFVTQLIAAKLGTDVRDHILPRFTFHRQALLNRFCRFRLGYNADSISVYCVVIKRNLCYHCQVSVLPVFESSVVTVQRLRFSVRRYIVHVIFAKFYYHAAFLFS